MNGGEPEEALGLIPFGATYRFNNVMTTSTTYVENVITKVDRWKTWFDLTYEESDLSFVFKFLSHQRRVHSIYKIQSIM